MSKKERHSERSEESHQLTRIFHGDRFVPRNDAHLFFDFSIDLL